LVGGKYALRKLIDETVHGQPPDSAGAKAFPRLLPSPVRPAMVIILHPRSLRDHDTSEPTL
jgi:hypothetical protein